MANGKKTKLRNLTLWLSGWQTWMFFWKCTKKWFALEILCFIWISNKCKQLLAKLECRKKAPAKLKRNEGKTKKVNYWLIFFLYFAIFFLVCITIWSGKKAARKSVWVSLNKLALVSICMFIDEWLSIYWQTRNFAYDTRWDPVRFWISFNFSSQRNAIENFSFLLGSCGKKSLKGFTFFLMEFFY